MSDERYVAAVDLGSHTFALVAARTDGGHAGFRTVDALKERVALTRGLRGDGTMERETIDRALSALARFGERLRGFDPADVRVVGTSALRVASRGSYFRAAAERALGFPVEIIEGETEARLVYVGVAHGGQPQHRRMVVDIGGGSTEVAMGEALRPDACLSRPVGHLERSQRLGPEWSREAYEELLEETVAELRESMVPADAPREVIGTGGTIRAVGKVLARRGGDAESISGPLLHALAKELAALGSEEEVDFPGLSSRRRPTFAGGVLGLSAVFQAFDVTTMAVSPRGLREGILHELLDHPVVGDLRGRTVVRLEKRFGVDTGHGARVARVAKQIAERALPLSPRALELLDYGARLHELGQAIRHRGYHKNGARILRRSSLAGFSPASQLALAALVRLHRPTKKIKSKHLRRIPDATLRTEVRRAVLALRLAVTLCRARVDDPLTFEARSEGDTLALVLPREWLELRPLTAAELDAELARWRGEDGPNLRVDYTLSESA